MKHGSHWKYRKGGCRCPKCLVAWARYVRERLAGDDFPHGTANGYANLACRCDDCKEAARQYQRSWRERGALPRYPVEPIQERIAYLRRCGQAVEAIAERVGTSTRSVWRMERRTDSLREDIAERWALGLGTMPEILWPEWWAEQVAA